jgi:hypothetical protein
MFPGGCLIEQRPLAKQCELRQGDKVTTGWLLLKVATVGVRVELPDLDRDIWTVTKVYDTEIRP